MIRRMFKEDYGYLWMANPLEGNVLAKIKPKMFSLSKI